VPLVSLVPDRRCLAAPLLPSHMDLFAFPTHKSFRGIKEVQETTREVLELESRAATVKSSKKKGKLKHKKEKKQAQLTDEYADLIEVEAQFKKKEKIVAYGFAVFVPVFLVGSYAVSARRSSPAGLLWSMSFFVPPPALNTSACVACLQPFVPLPYMPLLGMLSLLPVAAIFTIYREDDQTVARPRPENLWSGR